MNISPRWFRSSLAALWVAANLVPPILTATPSLAEDASTKKYSPAVVEKAQQILQQHGLRRSGRSIQATETAEISRAIIDLAREKRALRMVYQEWTGAADQVAQAKQELRALNAQEIDLNLKLARVAQTDVKTSNQLVALLNASRARMREVIEQREQRKKNLMAKRADLNDAETRYADTVLAIRQDFSALQQKVGASLQQESVQIALRVMAANFQSPPALSAAKVLEPLEKRIAKIEQEIFSESLELQRQGGALYIDVVVGKKTARMVVDSGASLVTLPASTAAELGIHVPLDARVLKLVLADGRSIDAHGVVLPRVRIGEFEAENVEAAVLDSAAIQAEPLLGMSFLGNFKFELDASQKRLTLLRVAAE